MHASFVHGLCLSFGLAACGADNTASNVSAPGADESVRTEALDAGAAALQSRPPIEALNAYLNGFHFYNGRMRSQMEAHHYCATLNEDVTQCVIYDGNTDSAKIMGVEYIVSERLFEGLPQAEKALWHSHVHEVKSGQLDRQDIAAPAIDPGADAWQHGRTIQLTDPTGGDHAHPEAAGAPLPAASPSR